MMNRFFQLGLALSLAVALASPAMAYDKRPGVKPLNINQRQAVQQQRIQEGVQSGQLNKREAFKMQARQNAIAKKEQFYRRDGELSPRERHDLRTDLNQSNRRIHHQKHDTQRLPQLAPMNSVPEAQ